MDMDSTAAVHQVQEPLLPMETTMEQVAILCATKGRTGKRPGLAAATAIWTRPQPSTKCRSLSSQRKPQWSRDEWILPRPRECLYSLKKSTHAEDLAHATYLDKCGSTPREDNHSGVPLA